MKKLLQTVSLGVAVLASQPAFAQAIAPAKVAIVDLERVARDCNACKAANTALQAQVTALQTRKQQLTASLQPEATYLDGAIKALNGKPADATLNNRIQAYQQKQAAAAQELEIQQATIQRNQSYVSYQISQKLQPIYTSVMTKRGANLLVEEGQTLAHDNGVDVTADVLAALNASLPSLSTVAPPPQQQAAQPQAQAPGNVPPGR